jgi:hypothetical protein
MRFLWIKAFPRIGAEGFGSLMIEIGLMIGRWSEVFLTVNN